MNVESTSDLQRAWTAIARALERDPALSASFMDSPVRTLRRLGFELSPVATAALLAALP